jgi:hypothetical protein
MRHIVSIVLSMIFAPIIYILTGVGMVKFAENGGTVASGQSNNWTDVGVAAGSIVVAGALWAVLTMVRMSPLGPLIAGLVLIGAEIWGLQSPADLVKLFGTSVMGVSGAAEAPLNGPALLMAIPMLATIFSARRWRGKDKLVATPSAYPATYNAGPNYPEPTSAAPNYPTSDGTYVPPVEATETETVEENDTYVPATEPTTPLQTTPETAGDARITSDEAKSGE